MGDKLDKDGRLVRVPGELCGLSGECHQILMLHMFGHCDGLATTELVQSDKRRQGRLSCISVIFMTKPSY